MPHAVVELPQEQQRTLPVRHGVQLLLDARQVDDVFHGESELFFRVYVDHVVDQACEETGVAVVHLLGEAVEDPPEGDLGVVGRE